MSNNNKGSIFGKGYYIALILCAAAIGISGYMYYRNANQTETQLQEPAADAVMATESLEDIIVVVTHPAQEQEDVQAGVAEPAAPEDGCAVGGGYSVRLCHGLPQLQ